MTLTPKQLQELSQRIAQRREALLAETQEDVERAREESFGALAGGVMDTGDEASADLLADLDKAEVARDVRGLRELEAAEARLASGAYGKCTDCGAEIDFERLRAYPTAGRCVKCQRVHEKTFAHAAEPRL